MQKNKNITGTCALCNTKNVTLTKEHIFPGAKRNRSNKLPFQAKINDPIGLPILESQPPMDFQELSKKGVVRHEQGGPSIYSLCKKCNSNTGTWYGNAYINWKDQWDQISISNLKQNSQTVERKITFNPLRLLKQIVSCFISVDYSDHKGNPLGSEHLRSKQPKLFDFVLNPKKRCNFSNLRIFVHLLSKNCGQGHNTGHILAYDPVRKKDLYPYILNLMDDSIQYSLIFNTNGPYEPQYNKRQILDISKYSIYPDREITKNLRIEKINGLLKIEVVP